MTTPMSDREALARIIDGRAWALKDHLARRQKRPGRITSQRLADSLAKADQWLARSSGGGEADLRAMRAEALALTIKHGDPRGTAYRQGVNDQGYRWINQLDRALAALPSPAPSGVGEVPVDIVDALMGPHEWGYRDPVEGGFIEDTAPFDAAEVIMSLRSRQPDPSTIPPALAAPAPLPSGVVELKEALEPFARLELPKRPQGNAGVYSIFHKHIEAARAAIAAVPMEGRDGG